MTHRWEHPGEGLSVYVEGETGTAVGYVRPDRDGRGPWAYACEGLRGSAVTRAEAVGIVEAYVAAGEEA